MNDIVNELLKRVLVLGEPEYSEQLPDATLVSGVAPYFGDDLRGACGACGRRIYYRPYNQTAGLKICIFCFLKLSEAKPNA